MALITLRHGTAAAWTTANPTLGLGEVGVETDTGKLKVGNGTQNWAALVYTGATGGGAVSSVAGRTGAVVLVVGDISGLNKPIYYAGTTWPARTANGLADRTVSQWFVGPLPGPTIGTGAANAVSGIDFLIVTG